MIAASVDDVWAGISTPGYLEAVHPFCEHNPVMVWPGSAARDEIHYRSGWVYQRTFTDWIDGVGYDLDIGAAGEPISHVSWRLAPQSERACQLTISVWPRPLTRIPVSHARQLPHLPPLHNLLATHYPATRKSDFLLR